MKKIWIFLVILCLTVTVSASTPLVIDNAGLLTDGQVQALTQQLEDIRAALGIDVVVLTESSLDGASPMNYADDYYDYNPEKAKELLLEAGYTQAELDAGVPIGNIVAIAGGAYAKASAAIQQMLAQVGLKVEVTTFEQATVEDMFYRFNDYDDLTILCHGDTVRVDTANYYASYIKRFEGNPQRGLSKDVETLGAQACAEFDETTRNELWGEFWQAVKEDGIYYSLYHKLNPYIATNDLNVVLGVNYYSIYDWSWK